MLWLLSCRTRPRCDEMRWDGMACTQHAVEFATSRLQYRCTRTHLTGTRTPTLRLTCTPPHPTPPTPTSPPPHHYPPPPPPPQSLESARNDLAAQVGNYVHESVPVSQDEAMNAVVREWGQPRQDARHNHVDLVQMLGIANLDQGVVSGSAGVCSQCRC